MFDGAYAAGELIRPLLADGAAIVTRLRHDAKLFDLPTSAVGRESTARTVSAWPSGRDTGTAGKRSVTPVAA